jgi:hypothetical protein
VDPDLPALPIGHSGRLEAVGLRNAIGNHALLVRQDESARALFTAEPTAGGRERLVVIPLDEDVEVRVDGDALAVWLADGSVGGAAGTAVPAWASAIGFVLVILIIGFVVLGGATFFAWVLTALGGSR